MLSGGDGLTTGHDYLSDLFWLWWFYDSMTVVLWQFHVLSMSIQRGLRVYGCRWSSTLISPFPSPDELDNSVSVHQSAQPVLVRQFRWIRSNVSEYWTFTWKFQVQRSRKFCNIENAFLIKNEVHDFVQRPLLFLHPIFQTVRVQTACLNKGVYFFYQKH